MLRLMVIQRVRENEHEHTYQVTLDRDGETTEYEFIWEAPPRPGLPPCMNEPMEIVKDLIDYQWFAPPGQPQGAFVIPPLRAVIQYVFKAADGEPLDFPIVLDER